MFRLILLPAVRPELKETAMSSAYQITEAEGDLVCIFIVSTIKQGAQVSNYFYGGSIEHGNSNFDVYKYLADGAARSAEYRRTS